MLDMTLLTNIFASCAPILVSCVLLHGVCDALLRCVLTGTKKKWRTQRGTHKAELMSYEIVCLVTQSVAFYLGGRAYFTGDFAELGVTLDTRLYASGPGGGAVEAVALLACLMTSFETYNFLLACVVPEKRTADFLSHHAASAGSCLIAAGGFVPYASLYMAGMSMLSSIPISASGIFACLQPPQVCLLAEFHWAARANVAARALFGVSFLVMRIALWTPIALQLFSDLGTALATGNIQTNVAEIYYILVTNLVLFFLQYFWGYKVVRGLWKAISATRIRKQA